MLKNRAMSKQKSTEALIKQLAKESTLPRCLCILSPDKVRAERATDYLITSIAKNSGLKSEIFRFNLRGIKESELRSLEEHALSPSLFSPRSVIVLTSVEHATASIGKEILSLVENSMSADFIISGEKIAKNTTFYKRLSKKHLLTNFAELKGQTLNTWIGKELKRNEITDVSKACLEIISQVGEGNLDTIVGMCKQLSLYSDDGSLSPKDIYTLFHQIADPNEFGLPEVIVRAKPGDIEIMIEELIQTGKSAFLLVSRLFWTYTAIGKINGLKKNGISQRDMASEMGVSDWILRKYIDIAKHYKSEHLPKCMNAIAKADSKLKNKSAGEASILSELCFELSP